MSARERMEPGEALVGDVPAALAAEDPGTIPAAFQALHADAVAILSAWRAPSPAQAAVRAEFLAVLASEPGGAWRDGPSAHVTASAIVLDEHGEQVLLTHHRKAGLWLQFGGHLESGDASVFAAAAREAAEESGIANLRMLPGIADLDRHALGGGFSHCTEHLDVRFVAVAPAGAQPVVSDESHDVRWWSVGALPAETSPDLVRLIASARGALSALTQL